MNNENSKVVEFPKDRIIDNRRRMIDKMSRAFGRYFHLQNVEVLWTDDGDPFITVDHMMHGTLSCFWEGGLWVVHSETEVLLETEEPMEAYALIVHGPRPTVRKRKEEDHG